MPSTGGPVVLCGQKNGRTGMTMLIVVFRRFANAPKTAVLRVNERFSFLADTNRRKVLKEFSTRIQTRLLSPLRTIGCLTQSYSDFVLKQITVLILPMPQE